MGLLGRFSSLSRKSRTKSSEQPPLRPMMDPLKQDLVTLDHNVSNDTTWVAPSTGSSLFDDIFMELGQSAQANEVSFAQLDLGQDTATAYHTAPHECQSPHLTSVTHEPIKISTTPTILDSDVSEDEDEDEEEDSDESSDDEHDTLGPIMPRLDSAKTGTMLDRMKDRHRQQVQALRQPHVFKSMMMHNNSRVPSYISMNPGAQHSPPPPPPPPQRTHPATLVRTQSMTFSSSSRRQGSVNSDDTGKKRPTPALKSMSSESDLARLYHHPAPRHHPAPLHYHQQMILQQQLRLEWERIQLYQHQLQHDYQQLQRSTTLPSFQPYYYPSYYPILH